VTDTESSPRLFARLARLPSINGYKDMAPYGNYIARATTNHPRYMEYGSFNGISATFALVGLIHNPAPKGEKRMVCVDLAHQPDMDELAAIAGDYGITFEFQCCPSWEAKPLEDAVYLLDSWHNADTVRRELTACHESARLLLFHDTDLFGYVGNDGSPGVWAAIGEFLAYRAGEWVVKGHLAGEGLTGLTVLERKNPL
jgi:hypothetical protein